MRAIELERTIGDLAAGQWGLFTAAQARKSGISRVQLVRLTDADVLIRLTHGVYVLRGAAGIGELELRAAWLALDPERTAAERQRDVVGGAVVSHATAARLRQLGDLDADRHEFTLPTRKQSRRPDVRLHRGTVTAREVSTVAGLPVTTSERIIVDLLADHHDGEHVAGVLAAAVRARSIDVAELAPRLGAFATRFGFSGGGNEVLDHLLDIGGAADLVAAEGLVNVARTNRFNLAAVMNGVRGDQLPAGMLSELAESLASFQAERVKPGMSSELAKLMATVNAAQAKPGMSSELAKLMATLSAAQLPAGMSPQLAQTAQIIRSAQAAQRAVVLPTAATRESAIVELPAVPESKRAKKPVAPAKARRPRRNGNIDVEHG